MKIKTWLMALALLAPAPAARAEGDICGVPAEYYGIDGGFPNLMEKVREGEAPTVVVLGSASSLGAGTSGRGKAFPDRMAAALGAVWAGRDLALVNLSRRGMSAEAMVASIETEVLPRNPDLVIWETGTVEAVEGGDPGAFGETLREGIDRLNGAGIDVLLVDPQYSPPTAGLLEVGPYSDAMFQAAQEFPAATLFPRLAIMTFLEEEGLMSFTETAPDRRRAVADQLHDCLGRMMAEMVDAAIAR
jgi:hypothetical protein